MHTNSVSIRRIMPQLTAPWILFFVLVVSLLILDLGVLHKRNREIGLSESLYTTLIYIIISCMFGTSIWHFQGHEAGMQFFSGYLVEKSLSMDNVFVISIIFSYLGIARSIQHRILFWGISSVIIMRGVMIYVGAELVSSFSWMLYVFGGFLIATGAKLLLSHNTFNPSESKIMNFFEANFNVAQHDKHFFVKIARQWHITKLFIALMMVEVMDLIFAIDSIPAIVAITTDFYIVYTSNIFAILGLRSLYFALDHMATKFYYIKHALAIILIFIGAKVFIAHIWSEIPIEFTLLFTVGCLAGGVIASIKMNK